MILDRLLPRRIWEAKLRRWGCKPLDGKGPLNTAEWWIGTQGPFTVPIEGEEECCDFWALQRLCRLHGRVPSELDDEPIVH